MMNSKSLPEDYFERVKALESHPMIADEIVSGVSASETDLAA